MLDGVKLWGHKQMGLFNLGKMSEWVSANNVMFMPLFTVVYAEKSLSVSNQTMCLWVKKSLHVQTISNTAKQMGMGQN